MNRGISDQRSAQSASSFKTHVELWCSEILELQICINNLSIINWRADFWLIPSSRQGTAEVVEAIDEVNDLIYSVAGEKVIIFDGSSLSVDHKPLMRPCVF